MEAVVTSVCENIGDSEERDGGLENISDNEERDGGMAKPKLSPEGNNKENQARNIFYLYKYNILIYL